MTTPVHPLAPGSQLVPAVDLRAVEGGRILIGGAPLTILRLSRAGAELARRWFAGAPIEDRRQHHVMARRLEANGMAHLRWPRPEPNGEAAGPHFTVVVPVRDDRAGLERTLRSLDGLDQPLIIVDDGSRLPIVANRPPLDRLRHRSAPKVDGTPSREDGAAAVRIVRRDDPGGPGVARQTAVDHLETPVVVFVDAGVAVRPSALADLVAALDDPAVVAAAPRVRSEPRPHAAGRYDERRSPLDLGPVESLVGPGRQVPYVPSACLAIRTGSLRAVGGFDPGLRYGEDVDLVWRLAAAGTVRYLPHLTASHRPRPTVAALAGQRRAYGSAAAPLADRHGAVAVSPCRVSPWSVAVSALAFGGHPVAAAGVAVGTGLALKPKIDPLPDAGAEAMRLTLRGHWYGGLSLLTALARTWAPLLPAAFLLARSRRRQVAVVATAAFGRRLLDGPRRPSAAVSDLGLGVVDDLAYCVGVWQGAARQRSAAALRPTLSSWPGGRSGTARRVWRSVTGR